MLSLGLDARGGISSPVRGLFLGKFALDNRMYQLQYNPNCGDGITRNQTCYLGPNSGLGNFSTLQEISPNGLPRVLQFSARFTF